MPYETDVIPEKAARPIRPHDLSAYDFDVDLWLADVDDLMLFDPENPAGNVKTVAFLDRVITQVRVNGEALDGPGVTGKHLPWPVTRKIFEQVTATMKELNSPKG